MPIEYAPKAAAQLDALEQSADDQTWDAICSVLELIDQHPDSAQARREEITGSNGKKMWKVPVRSPARPQASALAEVSGAYQSPTRSAGQNTTEPLGANLHYRPARGVARSMNNETAGRHEESPHLQCGEDVNDT